MAYKDMNKEEGEGNLSRINAAGIINITLENLWRDCYTGMVKGDLVTWNRRLDAIWVLLGGDCEEGGTEDKKIEGLDDKIYETGKLNHKKTGFSKLEDDEAQKMSLQYLLLKKKSLFLRRLQNKQGKGTAYHSDDEDDME